MPKKKKVDAAKLIKGVEDQTPSKEIMAKFGFKTLAQLKTAYLDALTEKGKVPGLVSARGQARAADKKIKELKVSKRGSLVVPKEIIVEMGFQVGDSFSVRKTAAGVSLKKK